MRLGKPKARERKRVATGGRRETFSFSLSNPFIRFLLSTARRAARRFLPRDPLSSRFRVESAAPPNANLRRHTWLRPIPAAQPSRRRTWMICVLIGQRPLIPHTAIAGRARYLRNVRVWRTSAAVRRVNNRETPPSKEEVRHFIVSLFFCQ